ARLPCRSFRANLPRVFPPWARPAPGANVMLPSTTERTMKTRTLLAAAVMMAAFGALAKQPVDTGHGGAVATISHEASLAAMEILNAGGNAMDAGGAAAGRRGVRDPLSCGLGRRGYR